MDNPYLLFEFLNRDGIVEPLAFSNPVRILKTDRIEEVTSIMRQVETATDEGYYAAGFVSYEAAPAFNRAMKVRDAGDFPFVWFGIFKEPKAFGESREVQPDQKEKSYREQEREQIRNQQQQQQQASRSENDYHVSKWQMAGSPEAYQEGIQKIKQAIEEGDTYQVNYTERLHADFSGNDFMFYRQLARNQQANYGAYLNIGNKRILSASPELFFRVQGGLLTTKPMKGTAARGRTLREDNVQIAELLASEKERAENLMIVDLLRNDMSRLAKKGTVKVEKLLEVETYPTVHQMTSTITAEIEPEGTILDWFNALFPCGSITGAPKISTMQKIAELETTPREVYCGAIGFITPDKNAVFNVPIRTVIIDKEEGKARYGVGGGVTWDSTSEGEFKELQTKAEVLTARTPEFQLLESLKLENGDFPLLTHHMKRLLDSAAYFKFAVDAELVTDRLAELAGEFTCGSYKVRLLLERTGGITATAQQITPIADPVRCTLATVPVDRKNAFLYHKTTNRQVYEKSAYTAPTDAFSILLWNEKEELTEFTIGNLVVEKDGKFYTPPVDCGLLPGTFRQQLIDAGKIKEKILSKDELNNSDAVWFINSVRGWLRVEMI